MALIDIEEQKKYVNDLPVLGANKSEVEVNPIKGTSNFKVWLHEHKPIWVGGLALIVFAAFMVFAIVYIGNMLTGDEHEHVYENHLCKYCGAEERYSITFIVDSDDTETVSYSYFDEDIVKPKITQKNGYIASWGEISDDGDGKKVCYVYYEVIHYSINYYVGEKKEKYTTLTQNSYTVNDEFMLENIAVAGNSFEGWYLDSSYTTKLTKINKNSTGDIDLYGKLSPYHTTISFNVNDGSGSVDSVTINALEDYVFPEVSITKRANKFLGWSKSKNGNVEYKVGDTYKAGNANEKITLYAVWEKNHTILVFNANGGIGAPLLQYFECFNPTKIMNVPYIRTASTLIGWSTSPDGDVEYELNQEFIAGEEETTLQLYAVWDTNKNYVTFDRNGGTGTMDSFEIKSLDSIQLPECEFKYIGSKFIGWALTPVGEVVYEDKDVYMASEKNEEVILYAVWAVNNQITIHFDNNGGSGYHSDMSVEILHTINLPVTGFTKEGLTFAGWGLNSLGTVNYTTTYTYNTRIVGEEITLFAIYDENRTIIHFDGNGGTGEMEDQEISAGFNAYINENQFERPGYKFLGWSYVRNGQVEIQPNSLYLASEQLVILYLYAVWERNTVTLYFDKNGGSGGAMLYQEIDSLDTQKLSKCKFVKENSYFAGWATSPNGEIAYLDEGDYTAQNDSAIVYLYAIYKTNKTIIRYHANEGAGTIPSQEIEYNHSALLSECTFVRLNYVFVGWAYTTEISSDDEIIDISTPYVAGNEYKEITLYAIWKRNSTTIHFEYPESGQTMESVTLLAGETKTLPKNTFTKTGYSFSGWSLNNNGVINATDEADFSASSDNKEITLYPVWVINKTTIRFNANGGVGSIDTVVIDAYAIYTLPECPFAFANMHFYGWGCNNQTVANYDVGEKYIASNTIEEVTFFAIWKSNIQTLQLNENNGTNTVHEVEFNVYTGDKITIENPEKENYKFLGWSQNKYATHAEYSSNEFIVLGDMSEYVLYAVFELYKGTLGIIYNPIMNGSSITGYEIVNYVGEEHELVIPGYYNNIQVVGIAENAFKDNLTIQSVIIVSNVKEIGDYAFSGCTNLTSITFNKTMETIGDYAFENTSIVELDMPSSITQIGVSAFENVTELEDVILSTSLVTILENSFANTGIGIITIPTSVKAINANAFKNCTSLENVLFSNGLETIGTYAFSECSALKNVILPDTIKTVDKYAFYNDSNVEFVVFGESLENINAYAFANCTKIEELIIPESVKFLGEAAFMNTGVKTVEILCEITILNKNLFASCNQLESIVLPGTIQTILSGAINGTKLTSIYIKSNDITVFTKMDISENAIVSPASVYYYSDSRPNVNTSDYWHYENDQPVVWK